MANSNSETLLYWVRLHKNAYFFIGFCLFHLAFSPTSNCILWIIRTYYPWSCEWQFMWDLNNVDFHPKSMVMEYAMFKRKWNPQYHDIWVVYHIVVYHHMTPEKWLDHAHTGTSICTYTLTYHTTSSVYTQNTWTEWEMAYKHWG